MIIGKLTININELIKKPSKARPSGNGAEFTKYGKKIKIHDFIQEGRDGTEITDVIERAGGLDKLKAAKDNSDTSDIVVDMSLNIHQAQKQMKVARLVENKIKAEKAAKDAEEKAKKEQEQKKGDNE